MSTSYASHILPNLSRLKLDVDSLVNIQACSNSSTIEPNTARTSMDDLLLAPSTVGAKTPIRKKRSSPSHEVRPNINTKKVLPTTWTYPQATDGDYQNFLKEWGFVVVPTQLTNNAGLREKTRQDFFQHIKESPEFLNPKPGQADWKPQLGGFAAMGNPSSFHHEWVRKMREQLTAEVLMSDALPAEGRKLEKTFDRLLYRIEGEAPTPEALHRDVAPEAKDGDDIFGGWVNFDEENQSFLCVPKTHTEVGGQNKGFAKIRKEEHPIYQRKMRRVEIPPGCVLLFYERIVHEVVSKKAERLMLRMHLGFRVTNEEEPLFGTNTTLEWIRTQGVPKIKSGQTPLVYPSAYPNFPKNFQRLTDWSQSTFHEKCIYTHVVQSLSEKWNNTEWKRVHAKMHSLQQYGFDLHRPYDEHEVRFMFPQREWMLFTFDSPNERVSFRAITPQDWQAFRAAQFQAAQFSAEFKVPRPKPERD